MIKIQQKSTECILTTTHILCMKTRTEYKKKIAKNCVKERFRLLFHRGVAINIDKEMWIAIWI